MESKYMTDKELKEERQALYKIKINKEILYEFLLCDEDELGQIHIDEVYKVLNIVFNKYSSSYSYMKKEVCAQAFATMLDRRAGYNPDMCPYNFLYTMARNEIGNVIYRWTKESHSEDDLNYREPGHDIETENLDLPASIVKYAHYLSGEMDFTVKRISKKDAVDILIFLRLNERKPQQKAPDMLRDKKNAVDVLYRIIRELIS